jgi:dTDP-glucose 4,6-dehydratase
MQLLVTGGAGFIGSNFIQYMLGKYKNLHIVCLDKLTYAGSLNNLKEVKENSHFTFVEGDICDGLLVEKLFNENAFDSVINFAAESHVDRSIDSSHSFIATNVLGTSTLLDACIKFGVKRFHQVSTDEVYGPLLNGQSPFTEDSKLTPTNPYAASKAAADMLVLSYYKTHGLNVTISRSSNNFGPHQYPEKLIPLVIVNAMNNAPIPIYGDGLNERDWLHVYDDCTAIDAILSDGICGQVYNISAHNQMTNLDVVRKILKIMGKPTSLITFVKDRKAHDLRYDIDTAKIEQALNWHPIKDFDEELANTILWYTKK